MHTYEVHTQNLPDSKLIPSGGPWVETLLTHIHPITQFIKASSLEECLVYVLQQKDPLATLKDVLFTWDENKKYRPNQWVALLNKDNMQALLAQIRYEELGWFRSVLQCTLIPKVLIKITYQDSLKEKAPFFTLGDLDKIIRTIEKEEYKQDTTVESLFLLHIRSCYSLLQKKEEQSAEFSMDDEVKLQFHFDMIKMYSLVCPELSQKIDLIILN